MLPCSAGSPERNGSEQMKKEATLRFCRMQSLIEKVDVTINIILYFEK